MTMPSILNEAAATCPPCAGIQPEQVAGFLGLLETQARRLDLDLVGGRDDLETMLAHGFVACVDPLPLAAIARIFDYDLAVIALVDEAQYRGSKVATWRESPAAPIRMALSSSQDGRSPEVR